MTQTRKNIPWKGHGVPWKGHGVPWKGHGVPWKGWKSEKPNYHQRTVMRKKCGSKCFLGPKSKKSFPICKKNTCKVSRKGVYAAYVRARQTKHNRVAQKAKRMLHQK